VPFVKQTRVLAFMGLFIAMNIVLTRILSFETPFIRVSFSFIPVAFSAIMFGPLIGGVTAALADILGMIIFPKGPYFPGFTFSALLSGAIYGFFLHRKPKTVVRILWAAAVIFLIEVGLDTIWVSILYNKAVSAIIGMRLIKSLLMLPVKTMVIYVLWRYVGNYAESSLIDRKIT